MVAGLGLVMAAHLSATLDLNARIARLESPTVTAHAEVEDLRSRVEDLEMIDELRDRIKRLEERARQS